MAFWLVCLGILAYSCQNTSRYSGYRTVTSFLFNNTRLLRTSYSRNPPNHSVSHFLNNVFDDFHGQIHAFHRDVFKRTMEAVSAGTQVRTWQTDKA